MSRKQKIYYKYHLLAHCLSYFALNCFAIKFLHKSFLKSLHKVKNLMPKSSYLSGTREYNLPKKFINSQTSHSELSNVILKNLRKLTALHVRKEVAVPKRLVGLHLVNT